MSNTYGNIHDYAFGEHFEAFSILLNTFRSYNLHHFLIGAQARDVHFFQQGIKPLRGTRDIDFAVMVSSLAEYNELLNTLAHQGFKRVKDPYRIVWGKGETVIDILPFGQIEENYTVNFDERNIELSVLGYREIQEETMTFSIEGPERLSVPVPPLHGLFILKLLSWDNQKPDREKDLQDLYQILKNYWEFVEDEAYEKHTDLFGDDFDIPLAAARILGRHLKTTTQKSESLERRIVGILKEQSSSIENPGQLLQTFSREANKSLAAIKTLLDKILLGMNDKKPTN